MDLTDRWLIYRKLPTAKFSIVKEIGLYEVDWT